MKHPHNLHYATWEVGESHETLARIVMDGRAVASLEGTFTDYWSPDVPYVGDIAEHLVQSANNATRLQRRVAELEAFAKKQPCLCVLPFFSNDHDHYTCTRCRVLYASPNASDTDLGVDTPSQP